MAGTMLRDARRAFVITAVGGLLSALLLFARHIYVQRESVEYSGVVRQSSGPGIPEAEVKAMAGQSIAFVTHTDSTGIFHTVLPSSSKVIHLLVQAPGYATRTSVIDLSTGTSEDIVLEKESAVLPQTAPQGPSVKVEAHGYKSSAINGNDNVVH